MSASALILHGTKEIPGENKINSFFKLNFNNEVRSVILKSVTFLWQSHSETDLQVFAC